ncbi:uncharacterized protein LOC143234990 [Tachypleus tridentatus]|uniref:uncharacterized protein LOC143234990 n=1 Tax=Tachypleus tridentatus TaxID=6853 RepID=UPI003FD6A3AB
MKFLIALVFLAHVVYTQAGLLGGYYGGAGVPHAGFRVGHAIAVPAFVGRGIPVGRVASHVTHINHGGVGVGLGGFGFGHGLGVSGFGHGLGGFGLGHGLGGFGLGLGHGGFGYGLGYGHGLGIAKFH